MKKTMIALMCAFGCFAASADNVITNVYDFKASLRVPYLKAGVRTYQVQTLSGYLYSETTDGQTSAMWVEVKNNKTKVLHLTEFGDGFYNLIGKTTRYSLRSTPSIYFEAQDIDNYILGGESHEFIKKIQFAGTGSLKYIKTAAAGCTVCGEVTQAEYCNILWKMNGYCTGVMDCLCPDDEDGWWHTVETTLCGVFLNDEKEVVRSHDAAIWGTWSATFNRKLSDIVIK